jgi:hypothetical protein
MSAREGRAESKPECHLLAVVGVFPSIRHAYQSGCIYSSPSNVLVLKFRAVYGHASCAVALGDIATLDHKLVDHAVKDGSFVR